MPAANIFWSGSALNETPNPNPPADSQNTSIASHATATSMNLVGKPPAGATDLTLHRGIAYGVSPGNFYAGNMADRIYSNGQFNFFFSDLRNTYFRAIVEGVGANNTVNSANRVDVVNSSWGGEGHNLSTMTKIVDAVAFEGNLTRGSTTVFSAGNSGPYADTVGSPAMGFNSIAVGALGEFSTDPAGTATYNVAATFSSRGPVEYRQPSSASSTIGTSLGNIRARIDIAAPGFQMRLASYYSTAPEPDSYGTWAGTSFAAPSVAGGIALLADYAWTRLAPADASAAVDGRVIKAVLINSAAKTSDWNNGQSWNGTQWTTSQGLDYTTGGGKLNLDQAFSQYVNSSGNPVTQLVNPGGTGPHTVIPTGWARAAIDRPDPAAAASVDFVLDGTLAKNTELNATLSWFVNRTSTSSGSALDVGFHNLDLEVWLADGLGNPVTRVGRSTADHNNTEHLTFLVPQDGQYLVRVLRESDTNGGTYYSFAGDTTSDVFGLAWMARPGLQATTGTTTIDSGTSTHPNVLIAPDSGQTAALSISGSSTRVSVVNRLFVGGTDRGAGGTGTLTVTAGAALDVSNALRVFSGGSLTVSGSTVTGGVLAIDPGASFSASGSSILQFSRIDLAAPLVVPGGASVTIRSYRDSSAANSGRLNILNGSATFNVDGQLTLQPVVTGSSGLIKNGSGTLILSPTDFGRYTYTGATQVNMGTLQLGSGSALPTDNNVIVAAGAVFNIGSLSNTTQSVLGTVTLNGGTFRVPSGSGSYYVNRLAMTAGTVDLTGSTGFFFSFLGSGAGIATNASATTAVWIGPATGSRIQNNTSSPLVVDVADGAAAIDLDAGIRFSNGGTNANFVKAGAGTLLLNNPGNAANFNVAAGRLRFDNPATLGTGTLTLSGGVLAYGNAETDGTTTKTITFAAPANAGVIEVMNAARTLTLSGAIDYGGRFLVKTGPGTLVLSGSNTGSSTSETSVQAGVLRAANSAAIPAGSLVRAFDTATFQVDSGITVNGNITVHTGGTLAGVGSVASGRTVVLAGGAPGGAISPGANAGAGRGTLTLAGSTSLVGAAGSQYLWQVNAVPAAGSAGTNWDFIAAGGALENASSGGATSSNRFVIQILADGAVTGFDTQNPYTWTVATFGGGIGIPQTAFAANPVGWGDLNGGAFSIVLSGNDLNVVYSPVPEPGMILVITTAVLIGGTAVRRGRQKSPAAS